MSVYYEFFSQEGVARMRSVGDVVRKHVHTKAMEDVHALKSMLRDLVEFNERTPLVEKPRFDAKMHVRVKRDGKALGDFSTDLSLWTAVLPWETARGLSFVPQSVLLGDEDRSPARGMLFADPAYGRGGVSFWSGAITTPIDVAFLRCVDPHQSLKAELEAVTRSPLANRMLDVRYELLDFSSLDPISPGELTSFSEEGKHGEGGKSFAAATEHERIEMVLETRRFLFADAARSVVASVFGDEKDVAGDVDLELNVELSDDLFRDLAEKYRLCETFVRAVDVKVAELVRGMNTCTSTSHRNSDRSTPQRATRLSREVGGGDDDSAVALATHSFEKGLDQASGNGHSATRSSRFVRGDPQMKVLPKMDYELFALSWRLGLAQGESMRHFERMEHELRRGQVGESDLSALAELAGDPSICFPSDSRQLILAARRSDPARSQS